MMASLRKNTENQKKYSEKLGKIPKNQEKYRQVRKNRKGLGKIEKIRKNALENQEKQKRDLKKKVLTQIWGKNSEKY